MVVPTTEQLLGAVTGLPALVRPIVADAPLMLLLVVKATLWSLLTSEAGV
jgi:hypothetical protein